MEQQNREVQSEQGLDHRPKLRPKSAKCTRRQLELPMELQPCRKRNHTRGLKSLAERLEAAIDRIANDDTVSPEQLEYVLWKLRVAANLLDLRLKAERSQGLVDQELGPQTPC